MNDRALQIENRSELMEFAKAIASSELKPAGIKTPADAFLVMAVGASYGFEPLQALQQLYVVKGKVTLSGEACAALIQSHPECRSFRMWTEGDGDTLVAHVESWRKGRPEGNPRVSFSMQNAKRAGLAGGDNWRKYPEDMLLWKAVARDKRRNWPDIMPGLTVREDMEGHEERNITPAKPSGPDPLLAGIGEPDPIEPEVVAPDDIQPPTGLELKPPKEEPTAGTLDEQALIKIRECCEAIATEDCDAESWAKKIAQKYGCRDIRFVPAEKFDEIMARLKELGA